MRPYNGITCLIVLLLPILIISLNPVTHAHGYSPATWSHTNQINKHQIQTSVPISHYSGIMPVECTHYATMTTRCTGTDTTYGTFSYSAPESYGVTDSCAYPCESQDILVGYPPTFTYKGTTYYFSSAQQDQCSPEFGCSTETSWVSTGPVSIPYSGTPVGLPVTIDTEIFYKNMSVPDALEVDFTYNLEQGYNYG